MVLPLLGTIAMGAIKGIVGRKRRKKGEGAQVSGSIVKVSKNKGDKKISLLLEELTLEKGRPYNLILDDLEVLRAENNKPWMEMYKLASKGDETEYKKLKAKADNYTKQINKL